MTLIFTYTNLSDSSWDMKAPCWPTLRRLWTNDVLTSVRIRSITDNDVMQRCRRVDVRHGDGPIDVVLFGKIALLINALTACLTAIDTFKMDSRPTTHCRVDVCARLCRTLLCQRCTWDLPGPWHQSFGSKPRGSWGWGGFEPPLLPLRPPTGFAQWEILITVKVQKNPHLQIWTAYPISQILWGQNPDPAIGWRSFPDHRGGSSASILGDIGGQTSDWGRGPLAPS